MNYGNIKLANERNNHLTKRLNRLSTWGFFKVMYRNSMGRLMATNFLMIALAVPLIYIMIVGNMAVLTLKASLPFYNSIGFGTGMWTDVVTFFNQAVISQNINTALWCILASIPFALMLSGGFAVIRDAFWVGDIKVFKRIGMGVSANIPYALVSAVTIGSMAAGLFIWFTASPIALWAVIVLGVLMAIVAMLVSIYLLILCSVSVTYKQSIKDNLKDSWYLLWLNILPNILKFVIMLIPIALYLLLGNMLQIIFWLFIFMVGGFFFPLVWQTHMMKTFALFHPVELNKKGQPKQDKQKKQSTQKAIATAEVVEVADSNEAVTDSEESSVEVEVVEADANEVVEEKSNLSEDSLVETEVASTEDAEKEA